MQNFIILTGGPGSGKTSILNYLNKVGFITVPEVARSIIKEQILINGDYVPWKNKAFFCRLMTEKSLSVYKEVSRFNPDKTVFFDRGIVDCIAYAEMEDMLYPTLWHDYAVKYRYHPKVFLLPPWKEIYVNDQERKQTWEQAVETYNWIKQTYHQFNYQIVELPLTTVENRIAFIIENLTL